MTQNNLDKYYKEIEVKQLDDGIIVVNLWKDKERECYNAISLMFAYGKIIYTGDMGYYIFGNGVHDIFTFYKGEEINPSYWREKVYCADRPIKNENCDIDEVVKLTRDDIEGYFGKLTEEQEEIWEDWEIRDGNPIRVYDDLESFYNELEIDPFERIPYIVEDARPYDPRYLWACEILQWVSNNLEKWLKGGAK